MARNTSGSLLVVDDDRYIQSAMADYLRSRMLHAPSSFACETVFSHESKLAFLSDARANGFKTYLYFISTEKPLINIDRVQVRTELGGHSVPREKIESRYWRTRLGLDRWNHQDPQ